MKNKLYTLITGASEGFGKALTFECARYGMNLILVALPGSGLCHLARYIENNFGVSVLYFEHDLSDKEECYKLFFEISRKKLSVNILVNNAGMGGTHFFEERDTEFYFKQIELNVVAPTLITHLFLKNLTENNPAHILNVSSMAGFFHLPRKQVYGATKSYLVSFSKSLNRELKQKGVYVSTVCPGPMDTTPSLTLQNHSLKGISRWCVMMPEEVAKISIAKMLERKELIVPGFWNCLLILLDRIMPERIKAIIIESQMKKVKVPSNIPAPFIQPLKKAV
jgi:uncharacterized protein